MGHTMSVHSQNDEIVLQFGLKKPAFRIVVNTPTTHGSIGLTTGLDPAMTLGCGGWGGNITSDNISPRHLLNIKRLAYGLRPAVPRGLSADGGSTTARRRRPPAARCRRARDRAGPERVDRFLIAWVTRRPTPVSAPRGVAAPAPSEAGPSRARRAQFVCEDDVRQAVKHGRKTYPASASAPS